MRKFSHGCINKPNQKDKASSTNSFTDSDPSKQTIDVKLKRKCEKNKSGGVGLAPQAPDTCIYPDVEDKN